MEVKIGIQSVPRELILETPSTADEVERALSAAVADDTVLVLQDEKGGKVLVGKAETRPARRGRLTEGQQHRVGVDRHDGGAGNLVQQAGRQRARAAAQIQDQRIGPARSLGYSVNKDSEPLLAVGHEALLLGIPARQPGACRRDVE